jgi:hypothetical protein
MLGNRLLTATSQAEPNRSDWLVVGTAVGSGNPRDRNRNVRARDA